MSGGGTLLVYKCPSCGGAVSYDAGQGLLTCRWCGNAYEADQLQAKAVASELQGYLCAECGAELMVDDFIGATSCPYCGNNEVAPHRFDGPFEPDCIIPFSVTKKQALQHYEHMLTEKQYLPDDFTEQSTIVSVQGTYVPFWLHKGEVDFDFTHYYSTGGKYATTQNQRCVGTYSFARVPADGSERMRDDLMDSIEPFEYDALVPFSPDYLPGFIAERYTVGEHEVADRIDRRVKNSAMHAARDAVEGNWKIKIPNKKRSRAKVAYDSAELALLPVWLIVVRYRDKKYLVGVNGQSGKVAVNLPIDKRKEGRETRKATVSDILMTLSVFAVVIIVIGIQIPFDEIDFAHVNFANLPMKDLILIIVIVVLFAAMLVLFAVWAFSDAKRKVKESMHNVEEASDADDFVEEGNLSITLCEKGKGPVQDQDNWPDD